jgi:hypothetical protein
MSRLLQQVVACAPVMLACLLLRVCAPLPATARTIEVGSDRPMKTPSEAAAIAQDGDHIVIDAGAYFDCAVWRANNLVIEGTGQPADTVITDKTCMGKALFITTGQDITVRNLTLTRARVPDGNGAGIRMEGRNLTVEHVRFINNQNGILTISRAPDSVLVIRDSAFIRNGACEKTCSHGVYAGHLDLLHVERSEFTETRQGHHIKSRAGRTEVLDCDIEDGPEGTASYLIEAPNGGSVLIRGNTLQKGPKSENRSTAISIGAEGVDQPTREITIEDNAFRLGGSYRTVFVTNMTATEAMLKGNRIPDTVKPLRGDGEVH